MDNEACIVVVILDSKYCRKLKNPRINLDGKVEVFLTDKSTLEDTQNDKKVYGLSTKSGLLLNKDIYEQIKAEINTYLTSRFSTNWQIRLDSAEIK